jgi:hypothetical protein
MSKRSRRRMFKLRWGGGRSKSFNLSRSAATDEDRDNDLETWYMLPGDLTHGKNDLPAASPFCSTEPCVVCGWCPSCQRVVISAADHISRCSCPPDVMEHHFYCTACALNLSLPLPPVSISLTYP